MKDIETILELVRGLNSYSNKLKEKLPYHLNIIDELRASENAHSRIFARILSYNFEQNYPFLQSFINKVGINAIVKKPDITVEKHRIDCLIKDEDYVIIIENKINYANDQDEQIKRYVELINKQYPIEKIHVIYLTSQGINKVSETSLPNDLRKSLGNQFYEINFKDHILDWLENDALPLCRFKEIALISAIQQYIDHLNGLFLLRNNEQEMHDQIQSYLKEKLNYKNEFGNNELLNKTIEDTTQLLNQLHTLKSEQRNKLRKNFLVSLFKSLNLDNENWKCVNRVNNEANLALDTNNANFGFKNAASNLIYSKENQELFLSIEIQNWKYFVCGIFIGHQQGLKQELIDKFAAHNIKTMSSNSWVFMHLDNYEYENRKIAWNIYDDEWNQFYIDNTPEITTMFIDQITKMRNAWEQICKN